MKAWASAKAVRAEVADVPFGWLTRFAVKHPEAVRKLGGSRNATLLFNTEAVIKALNDYEGAKK